MDRKWYEIKKYGTKRKSRRINGNTNRNHNTNSNTNKPQQQK